MNYSDIKTVKNFCQNTIDCEEWRDVVTSLDNGDDDFEVGEYRFIKQSAIDDIQQGELSDDLYMLGCFDASFLANILNAPQTAIVKMQEAEAFEAIGEWVKENGSIPHLQEQYASADGYGHHFAHYDHEEHELNGMEWFSDYYAFKVN